MTKEQVIELIRDEIAGWPIGEGYYQTTIGVFTARDLAEGVYDNVIAEYFGADKSAVIS